MNEKDEIDMKAPKNSVKYKITLMRLVEKYGVLIPCVKAKEEISMAAFLRSEMYYWLMDKYTHEEKFNEAQIELDRKKENEHETMG